MARTEALIDLILNNVNATKELDKVQKELDKVQKRLDKIEKKAIINFNTKEIDKVEKRLDEIKRKSAINLDVRVINLERTFKTIKQVETAVASLGGQMRSLSAPGSGDLGDQLRVAANSANKFFDSLSKGNKYLANTTAGLTEQARAFASLAANINSADKRFIDYTQGAQAAQDKNLKPLFRQFEALRHLYQEGLTGQGAEITSREMGLGMFEALKKEVPNTEAALRSFYGELLRVRNLVESKSTAAFGVESQLIEIEEQLLRIEQERLEVRSALNRELSSSVQGSLARMEGGGRNPFGIPDAQVNAALDARAEAYSKQVDEVQNLKRALAGMEGASRDPFNISDQQINAGLEERARLYLKQVKDLDALGSALEQASSKKYNPFGIADEQINAALNERATLYVKQSQEIRSLMSALEQASGKKYDPFNVSDEQINAGLNERANLYAKQAEEMQALARSLEGMEGAARDPFGISDQQINAGLDARAQAFARQAQEMESLMRVLAGMEGVAVDPFNISDQQINAGLEERANLYSRQVVEIQALQNALQQASGKRYDPLGIADEQINAGLNERASLFVTQSKQLDEVQKALGGMEGRRVDPFGISDQQINAGLEQRASVYETQRKEIAALEEALGKMESRKVDWASALGIDAADVAAERARELTRQWEATQKSLKGFEGSFQKLQASFGETGSFFQNVSPEEAIDKIVRQFTPSLAGTTGLATLHQLEKPAKLSSQKLNLLASGLQELAAQIDPLIPGAKRLLREMNGVSASLQNEQAGRAPDADLLVRLTKNPRLAAGISEGLIGGAFPLLFGQGLGASVGGGLGGFAGGAAGGALGFGLSLIGTAIGSAIDEVGRKATELGGALNDSSKAFDLVKERSIFSTRELEKAAQKMQEAGNEVAASILAQQQVFNLVGTAGVRDFRELESASDRLSRAMAALSVQVQTFVAGPLASFLEGLASAVERPTLAGQAKTLMEELPRERRNEFIREINKAFAGEPIAERLERRSNPLVAASSLFKPFFGVGEPIFDRKRFALENVDPEKLREIVQKFEIPAEINISEDQAKEQVKTTLEGISSALSQQLEIIDIGKNLSNQYRNAAREQEDAARQRQEIEKSYVESIGDIRLGIERTVQKEALDGIRAQNELLKTQGEIRLQQFRNATAELVSAQGADEYGRKLFEILGQAGEIELSTQQEIENKKRDLELDLQSKAIETEIYKADIAKQVARLNESTAKSVADINKSIRRANEDYDERRFSIEREIAKYRLAIIKSETEQSLLDAREAEARYRTAVESGGLPQAQAEALLTATGNLRIYIAALESQKEALSSAVRQVDMAQPPPRKAEVAAVSTSGVSFAAYEATRERAIAAARAIAEANEEFTQLARQGNWQKLKEELLGLADQGFGRASGELNVFVQRYREFAAGRIGDEFSAPLEQLKQRIEDFEAFNRLEATGNTLKMMDAFKEAGMNREQIEFFVKLGLQTTKLSEAQLQGVRTSNFYLNSILSLSQEVESLSTELRRATEFGSEYDKAMASLVRKGLDPAAEASKAFLAEAEKIDILKQKIAIVEGFTFASDTLSGSLKDLVKQFAELGSASEAVERVSENIAKTSIDFVLDLAFKPVEEGMRKTMLDIATKLGFDISTPQERQLQNLVDINNTTSSIKDIMQKFISDILAVQSSVAPPSAGQAVPSSGPLATHDFPGAGSRYQGLPASQQIDGPQSSLSGAFTGIGGPDLPSSLMSQMAMEGGFEDVAQLVPLPVQRMYQQMGRGFTKLYQDIENAAKSGFAYTKQEAKKILAPDPVRTQQTLQRIQKLEEVRQNWNPIDAQWKQRANQMNPAPRSAPARASLDTFKQIVADLEARASGRANAAGGGWGMDFSDYLTPGEKDVLRKGVQQQLRSGVDPFRIEHSSGYGLRNQLRNILEQQMPGGLKPRPAPSIDPLRDKRDPWVERYMRQTEPPGIIPGVESQFEGSFLPGTGFDMASLSKLDTKYASIASDRQVFALPAENYSEETQKIEKLDNSLQRLGQTAIEGSQNVGISAESFELIKKYSTDSLDGITGSVQENVPKLNTATASWTKGLGQAVTGLSLAASSVIGIVGGIQNIQKGGAGNVLSGIGSILTTVGSIGMSVAGFMKPGIPGGGGFGAPAGVNFLGGGSALPSSFKLANGGVLDENSELMKFANGGIVQSPTLFSFEDAGVTRTGQTGEAGAEAIMPLKRTKDGRLGVEADLSVPFEASDALEMGLNDGDDNPKPVDLSVPFQKAQGRMSAAQMMQIAAESGLAIPFAKDQGGALGGGAVDGGDDTIKFESVIINNQEFVTKKEAEEIGRKAEARGASRGAQLAQKGIKNNPRVRASLGIK